MKKLIIDCDLLIKKSRSKPGPVWQIVDKCLAGEFQPITSEQILKECIKFLRESDLSLEVQDRLEDFFAISEIIKAEFDLAEIKRDFASNKYIQCALAGQADYLITSNKKLLNLQKYFRTEIV
ncbi:putative toxin-antitoxin system toxin component, PIN family, partial [Patescibacteria group bacterium]|nr:putative toxin-antitoxin system toxin component, PIN family [Patescibacteria group bacterium]